MMCLRYCYTALLTLLPFAVFADSAPMLPTNQPFSDNLPQPQISQPQTALDDFSVAKSTPTAQPFELENRLLPTVLNLMKAGQWQAAKTVLEPLLQHNPPSLHGLFLAGQIAEQQQDWQSAVGYYRHMLSFDATLRRPRLELARALAKMGELNASEYQFNLALSQKLPEPVQNNVFSMLQNLKAETSSFNLQLALLPSSNINQGTQQRSVILNDGKEYTLSQSSRAKRGVGLQIALEGEQRFGEEYKWFLNGALTNLDYANRQSDQTATRLSVGRSFGNQRGHAWDLSLGGQHLLYQHKGLYQGVLGRINYSWRLKPDWKLALAWETQQLHYRPEYAYQRGWQHWLSANLTHIAQGRTVYFWGVQQGFNQAAERNYSYRTFGVRTGVRHHFDFAQLTLGGSLTYTQTDYRDRAPFFGVIRHDKRWSGSVDLLKRNWSWKGFAPRLSFHYTDNRSTIPLNQYKNKQVRLVFSKEF
ncbi:surface lipoprotein assembly modifier [Testudinibacter sp. P80/BLE/0925]|uniref:surface lipoprotein assembly modifier n=1 Tax=Testudinibacter sp. TW-1 TaxID=3417757 RepID=UPI003D36DBCE